MQSGKESASIRQSGMYRSILNGCPTNDSLSPMVLRIIHRAPSMVRNVSIDPRPYLNMFEVIFWKLSFQKDISTFPEYFQVATSVEHTKSALKGPKSRIMPLLSDRRVLHPGQSDRESHSSSPYSRIHQANGQPRDMLPKTKSVSRSRKALETPLPLTPPKVVHNGYPRAKGQPDTRFSYGLSTICLYRFLLNTPLLCPIHRA